MRDFIDRLTRWLARWVVGVFYRRIEVSGLEHVPAEGPVLFVANHGNAIVDPIVLVGLLPRMPRFLAKHTLWKNPALYPLLTLASAVPVYRAQDGDTSRNDETFRSCFDELCGDGAVALFPEGISHDEPQLQPLRTGAARIALGARHRGSRTVTVVPVGLTFDDKQRFRSRLLLRVGEPIVPDTEEDGPEAVRALTEEIDAAIRGVTLNVDSWQTARLVERAADVYASDPTRSMPGRSDLDERFSLRHAFGEGYEEARHKQPERFESLEAMAQRYDGMLSALRLRDDQITADYPWSRAAGYVGYRLPVLLLRLPFALVGWLLNYLPYRLPGLAASFVEEHGDQPATYKMLAGIFLFPIFWALEAGLAGWWWGGLAAGVVAIGAPITGWIALRFFERNESFWNELRAYLWLRLAPDRAAELRTLRGLMRDELHALVSPETPAPPAT